MSQLALGIRVPEPQAVCVAWDAAAAAGFEVSPDLVSVVERWHEDDRDFLTFARPALYPRMLVPEWPAFVSACLHAHAVDLGREAVSALRSGGHRLSTYAAKRRACGRWTWEPSYRHADPIRKGVYLQLYEARKQKGTLYGHRRLAASFGRKLAREINAW